MPGPRARPAGPTAVRTATPAQQRLSRPTGSLVGNGHRLIVVRGGTDPGVWTSSDGLVWSRLSVSGDIPSEQAMNAVPIPGGVVLSDRTTTWFGEAVTK
jgi:hypothetical protein